MKRTEFLNKMGINLDLAMEAHELVRGETGQEIPGVREDIESFDNARVTTVTIMDPAAEQIMGKPVGTYITIESAGIRKPDKFVHQELAQVVAQQLQKLINLPEQATALVVGLGNWNATPDAVGPMVVDHIFVTRHLFQYAPQAVGPGLRPVCALSPGVMGTTGIETAEIIKGAVEKIRPDIVIAVDALAASSVERISTTIQIANTGINPGSGVGNQRMAINQQTMGCPVIAIGVPTVVNAAVIAHEVVEDVFQMLSGHATLGQLTKVINPQSVEGIIGSVLQPFEGNLMVTPKEVDDLIKNISTIIASGVNQALHPAVGPDEAAMLH